MSIPHLLQADRPARRRSALVDGMLVASCILLVIGLGRVVLDAPLDHDEIEHAHVAWQMNRGLLPYVSFHQNHFPALWLLTQPILEALPARASALIALRVLPLLAFLATALAACLVVRRVDDGRQSMGRLRSDVLVLVVALLLAYPLAWYRVRPDPFMAALVAIAGALLALHERPSALVAISTGLALGLSALFSIKMWPFCVALLLVAALHGRRHGVSFAAQFVIQVGAGFCLPVLALLLWLDHHGLLRHFYEDVIAFNSGYVSSLRGMVGLLLFPPSLLALGGLVVSRVGAPSMSSASCHALSVSRIFFLCGLGLGLLSAQQARYNLQAATFGMLVMLPQLVTWARPLFVPTLFRLAAVMVVAAIAIRPIARDIVTMPRYGTVISRRDLDAMIALVSPRSRCFGLAPLHPVFCRDAVPLFLTWDLNFLRHPTPRFRERQRGLWESSLATLVAAPPDLVFSKDPSQNPLTRLLNSKRLDLGPRLAWRTTLSTRYHTTVVGSGVEVLVLDPVVGRP